MSGYISRYLPIPTYLSLARYLPRGSVVSWVPVARSAARCAWRHTGSGPGPTTVLWVDRCGAHVTPNDCQLVSDLSLSPATWADVFTRCLSGLGQLCWAKCLPSCEVHGCSLHAWAPKHVLFQHKVCMPWENPSGLHKDHSLCWA